MTNHFNNMIYFKLNGTDINNIETMYIDISITEHFVYSINSIIIWKLEDIFKCA